MKKKLLVALSVFLIAFSFMIVSCDNSSPEVPEQPEQPNPEVTYTVSITSDKTDVNVGSPVTYTASLSPALGSATYTWTVNGSAQSETSSRFVFTPTSEGKYTISVKASVSSNTASAELDAYAAPTAENIKNTVWYGIAFESKILVIDEYYGEYVGYDNLTYTSQYSNFNYTRSSEAYIPAGKYYSVEFDENGNGTLYTVDVIPYVHKFDTKTTHDSPYASDDIYVKSDFGIRSITFSNASVSNGKLVIDGVELVKVVGVAGAADINGNWEITDIVIPGSLASEYTSMLDQMMQYSTTISNSGIKNAVTVEKATANAKIKINNSNLSAMVTADIDANFVDNSFSLADIIPTAYLDTNITVTGNEIKIIDTVIPELPSEAVTYKISANGSVMLLYIKVSETDTIMVPLARTNSDLVVPTSGDTSFGGTVSIDNIWNTYDSIASVLPASITNKPIASDYGKSGIWRVTATSEELIRVYLSEMEYISFESHPLNIKQFILSTDYGYNDRYGICFYEAGPDGELIFLESPTVVEETNNTVQISYTSGLYEYYEGSNRKTIPLSEGTMTFALVKEFTNLKDNLMTMLDYLVKENPEETNIPKLELSKGVMNFYYPSYRDSETPTAQKVEIAKYFVKDGRLVATVNNGLFPPEAMPNGLRMQVSIPVSGKTLVLFNGSNGTQAGVVLK